EYFSGCGLLLQRLAGLSDEPRVFHRDDRLRGKVLEKPYLLFRKWPDLIAVHYERAENDSVLLQRNRQPSTNASKVDPHPPVRHPAVHDGFAHVRYMNDRLAAHNSCPGNAVLEILKPDRA